MLHELAALRLSISGWVLLLGFLFLRRAFDKRMGRDQLPGYRPIMPMPAPKIMVFIGLTIIMLTIRYEPPMQVILHMKEEAHYTLSGLVTVTLIQHAIVAMWMTAICYSPRLKFMRLAFWTGLSHVAIWWPLLW